MLLLVPTDTRAIARLGPKALVLALFGTLGTVTGATVSFGLLTWLLPPGTLPAGLWKGVAALGGSWIGGSTDFMTVVTTLGADPTITGKLVAAGSRRSIAAVVARGWKP